MRFFLLAATIFFMCAQSARAHEGHVHTTVRATGSANQLRGNLRVQNGPFYGNVATTTAFFDKSLGAAFGISNDHFGIEAFAEANMLRADASWMDLGARPYIQVGHHGGLFFAGFWGITTGFTTSTTLLEGELLEESLEGAMFFGLETGVWYPITESLQLELGPTFRRRVVNEDHDDHGHEVHGTIDQLGLRLSLSGRL